MEESVSKKKYETWELIFDICIFTWIGNNILMIMFSAFSIFLIYFNILSLLSCIYSLVKMKYWEKIWSFEEQILIENVLRDERKN